MLYRNKKGSEGVVSNVIMIALTLIIFSACFISLSSFASGAVVYEKAYSKQIALLLDNARPNTQIELDFTEGIEFVEKNLDNKLTDAEKKDLVEIKNNKVSVLLGKRSYSTYFFTNYDVEYYFDKNNLILNILEDDDEE